MATPYVLLTLTSLFWAGNSVIGRALHEDVPPVTLAFWRWTIALAILLPWSVRVLARQWPILRSHWKVMVLLSVLGIPAYNTINYAALHTTTATNSVLINAACTVMIIAVNRILFGVRAGARQWAGVAISGVGVMAIVSRGDPAALAGLDLVRGDLLLIVGALAWSLYTACLRWRPRGLDPIAFVTATIAIGVVTLAPLYAWEAAVAAPVRLSPGVLAGIAYTGLFPSVLAMLFWNRGVAEIGANRAGQFLNLVPVFGIALAAVFLDEALAPHHLVGAAVIFTGIYLATSAAGAGRDEPARPR